MNYCPKCQQAFFKNLDIIFCPQHQEEYDKWSAAEYKSLKCKCEKGDLGAWIEGTMQMTDPPTYPEMKVWRCMHCNDVQLEESNTSGMLRIVMRE